MLAWVRCIFSIYGYIMLALNRTQRYTYIYPSSRYRSFISIAFHPVLFPDPKTLLWRSVFIWMFRNVFWFAYIASKTLWLKLNKSLEYFVYYCRQASLSTNLSLKIGLSCFSSSVKVFTHYFTKSGHEIKYVYAPIRAFTTVCPWAWQSHMVPSCFHGDVLQFVVCVSYAIDLTMPTLTCLKYV